MTMLRASLRISPFLTPFLLVACGPGPTPPVQARPVESVTVAPATATLVIGDTVRLVATVRDSAGNVLRDRLVTWVSGNPPVATVSATGLVTGVQADPKRAVITATSERVSGSADIAVTAAVSFAEVEAGLLHSCGRAQTGAAYCWGYGTWGQLGNGSTAHDAVTPQAVSGGLTFALLSVGGVNSCGLTTGGAAYCWGADVYGGLGAPGLETCTDPYSQFPCSSSPLAVAGGRTFSALSIGWTVSCARTPNGSVYCWGDNSFGALGIAGDTGSLGTCTAGPCSRTPLAVAGGLAFTALAAGARHACGLTAGGAAYCWGDNEYGQLGIGLTAGPDTCDTSPCSRTPRAVAGELTFTALNVGLFHTCGRATDGGWYCWGANNYGQLGTGATGPEACAGAPCSSTPVPVSAGINLTAVFAGRRHSCGVTPADAAYCWGENVNGQLGDSTRANSLTPVAVAGGLSFASISPFAYHTCGLTTGGIAYCWGRNAEGQLGSGAFTGDMTVPVRVAGQPAGAANVQRLTVHVQDAAFGSGVGLPVPSTAPPRP